MNNLWILAQTDGAGAPAGVTSENVTSEGVPTMSTSGDPNTAQNGQGPTTPKSPIPIWVFLVFMVIMVIMFIRAPQKQKQQQKKLEKSLEKNDKVMTIGGIIGTIVDIKEDEVTLKVDESNNTKIKVRRSAIGRNLSKDKA